MSSSKKNLTPRDIVNPSRILSRLIQDYVDGSLDDRTFLYRAQVVAVDYVGAQLESSPAPNPKNSVRARILTLDRYKDDEDLTIFWPLFPFDLYPIKPGEHIYVLFEDAEEEHGLWLSRIPEPNNVDNINLTPGVLKYQQDASNNLTEIAAQQTVLDLDSPPPAVVTPEDFVVETVPAYTARTGDRVLQGSNNTVIVLGRDRPVDTASGQRDGAGTIDLVTGRQTENNDLTADNSRIYISSNTDVDTNFSIQVGESSGPSAAIAIKSNEIRIVARNGMKLVVEGGDVFINGNNIHLGPDANGSSAVLGDLFRPILGDIVDLLLQHTHPTPTGPSGPANLPIASIQSLSTSDLDSILSDTVKVKS